MNLRKSIFSAFFLLALAGPPFSFAAQRPNLVVIYADDLGWGDLSCYGNKDRQTPNLDRLAAEGVRLTDFYVSTPSCAPSRVALLTGRYPYRTGVPRNPAPDAGLDHGIRASETTLAEALKTAGYATQCIGKWHLGHLPQFYPTRHGFDAYFGILYSNDMRPVMLCRGEAAVEYPVVQSYLTQRYTAEALRFIEQNKDRNFFLYLPHAMPHKPLAASESFYTPATRDDLYSDVVRELDWSVGQVIDRLRDLGLAEKTLVMFASDNGPWFGGSTGGLRGMKGSGWEGGIRVPGIFRWPGRIPPGRVISEPCGTIDLFPTVCAAAGVRPGPLPLDGFNILPLLEGSGPGPKRAIFAWNGTVLLAVREGRWKLHVAAPSARPRGKKEDVWIDERGPDGVTLIAPPEQYPPWKYPSPPDTPATAPAKAMQLFDLEADPGEQVEASLAHPEAAARLQAIAQRALADVPEPEALPRPATKFFLGPGRITAENPMPIEEALKKARGND